MRFLRRILSGLLVLCMVVSIIPPVTAAETGDEGTRIILDASFDGCATVWVDGVEYTVQTGTDSRYVNLPEGTEPGSLVTYSYHVGDASDIHTQYPVGMKVWALEENADGSYTPEKVEDLTNILQYSGSSIRIVGNKGIRMITSIEQNKKLNMTIGNLSGYTLQEYGTVLAWSSDLEGGNPLVLGPDYAKSNYAYKRGVADPIFAFSGTLMQYTNVLVGFSLDQCKDDIAMRPYMILKNAEGEEVTLYGGIVHRSIGYIAWQNKDVFTPGTDAYNYVWEIINHVYAQVNFETNGGSAVETAFVAKGDTLKMPAAPVKDRYTFAGWYTDAALTQPFNASASIQENMTLYAKWNAAGSLPMPEDPSEKEAYYWNNAEIIDVLDADESEDVFTEADVITMLRNRGFSDFPIEYAFDIDGSYVSATEAANTSSTTHPVYYTYYISEDESLWAIYVINETIMAYPVSHVIETNAPVDILISETEAIASYDESANRFYINIPYSSVAIVKTVERIDAETLEQLTSEEINNLT